MRRPGRIRPGLFFAHAIHYARRVPGAVTLLARDIKVAHSVFALPFALLGASLAAARQQTTPARLAGQFALVVACMVAARTWAMLVNRLADRRFDAANPRTARRAIASGAVSVRAGGLAAAVCAAVFLLCCAGFWLLDENIWPLALGAPVLAWIGAYSYAKRFTWASHIFLGGALAASPIAAAIAIDPATLRGPTVWWLSAFVLFWVAGFDIFYALQDRDVDRELRLHSAPARFGTRGALVVARVLHACAIAALAMAWRVDRKLGALFGVGVALAVALIVVEHVIVANASHAPSSGSDEPAPTLNMAFFTLNGVVSCVVGGSGIAEVFGVFD